MWRPDVFSPRYVMTAQFGEWKRWGSSTTGTLALLLVVLTTGREEQLLCWWSDWKLPYIIAWMILSSALNIKPNELIWKHPMLQQLFFLTLLPHKCNKRDNRRGQVERYSLRHSQPCILGEKDCLVIPQTSMCISWLHPSFSCRSRVIPLWISRFRLEVTWKWSDER